ncbi:Os03g0782066 [Oryza sativa Japonica Group]|uniref:Os03g0782066 protein n=1 Tax=Oryza sativa subsp. japonica TaxID=39947 RepID=A0A0P0W3U5_ORYSJ|nr:Os03g0782066 [Oryza sativa Japonica Group]
MIAGGGEVNSPAMAHGEDARSGSEPGSSADGGGVAGIGVISWGSSAPGSSAGRILSAAASLARSSKRRGGDAARGAGDMGCGRRVSSPGVRAAATASSRRISASSICWQVVSVSTAGVAGKASLMRPKTRATGTGFHAVLPNQASVPVKDRMARSSVAVGGGAVMALSATSVRRSS